MHRRALHLVLGVAALAAAPLFGANEIPTIAINAIREPIAIDGALEEPAWKSLTKIDTWFETNPGDNLPPKVKNVGYLAYDDRFLYAAFEFADPQPARIRAPYGDRDNVPSSTDYGGIILDTQNEGKRAVMFLANPRGIQYDANTDDASGEDNSPDYFWDSAARVHPGGWTLEMRIPFSTLRYSRREPQTWRIMLYRNYPRDFRYQFFSTTLPKGGNCFICRSNPLTGLQGLPEGGKLIVAPYLTGAQIARPSGELGTELENDDPEGDGGLDAKWTPSENTALDLTINPDFSQIESDVAQIGVNERFALFFPEKRPFFLESIELFRTPMQAVYTRTITSPRWGARATGRIGQTAYTALLAEDRGGGSVIVPGPNGSSFADQDFRSYVFMGRGRRDMGRSFFSLLATAREVDDGGFNRVIGPDFEWRPTEQAQITGQFLYSWSETPERPDLADEWDGRKMSGHAGEIWWFRTTRTMDYFAWYRDIADEFRADNGFVPQVGYRRGWGEVGRTLRPTTGLFRRVRTFLIATADYERDGDLIFRRIMPGVGMDARWNSFLRFEGQFDEVRAGDRTFDRTRLGYQIESSPGRVLNRIGISGTIGDQVDFANARSGSGGTINGFAIVRPTDHVELRFNGSEQWLDVDTEDGRSGRLFTALVARLRTQYTFSARTYARLIGQWVETDRDPSLYNSEVADRDGDFSGSALFAYKLNWQSVLFVGYGDSRALDENENLEKAERQFFVKVSYAFQM
ncbi:MAG: DUF5916 domain-containing protein [Thermoanaerobaculia bacterium]